MRRGILWKDGGVLIAEVDVAARMWDRMRGLLGRADLPPQRALLLPGCGNVHTIGMHFALDIVFLDRCMGVVRPVWDVAPGRIVTGGFRARQTLEMAAGWFSRQRLAPGERVYLQRPL